MDERTRAEPSRRRPAILLAEDDAGLRHRLLDLLTAEGWHAVEAPGPLDDIGRLSVVPDLVVLGSSPGGGWARLAEAQRLRRWRNGLPIVLIATDSSERLAVAALKAGISDYFTHPLAFDELRASLRRALAPAPPGDGPRPGDSPDGRPGGGPAMIGDDPRMRTIQAYIDAVAASDTGVLITGETGTGKELTAARIHHASRRRQRPLVCINCAAIPDSLLESELFGYEKGAFTGAHASSAGKLKVADGGTVFFDEIGDMTPYAQAKILRLIESREVERLGGRRTAPLDVRFIAATNHDLERLMAEGRFRKDLFFRLNVARIHLPPLRERKGDIPALVDYYVGEFNRAFDRDVEGATDEALASLLRHDWPGNVRELRNVLESVFVHLGSRHITASDLPASYQHSAGAPGDVAESGERERLLAALLATRWNKSKAAERLHWSRMTVYRKIARYRLAETPSAGDEPRHDGAPPADQAATEV